MRHAHLILVFLLIVPILLSEETVVIPPSDRARSAAVSLNAIGNARSAASKRLPMPVVEIANVSGKRVCVDDPCRTVATNYHVVALQIGFLNVEGVGVESILRLTGPNDPCAGPPPGD